LVIYDEIFFAGMENLGNDNPVRRDMAGHFQKLLCSKCNKRSWECPACAVIMTKIAAHECCNWWWETQLLI
jgi:hypothetical protein